MEKTALLISIICLLTTFAAAQKTVRERPQTSNIQTNSTQKKSSQLDTPLKILDKPRPQIFSDGQDCSQGKVVLRVTFLETGETGAISVVSGLTKNRTESAIEAAKKIKFKPAIKGGKPVSVSKPVEYSFTN